MAELTTLPLFNSEVIPRSEETVSLDRVSEREKGFLIAFEGPDGSGKSTQLKLFKEWLITRGHEVVTTKWKSSPSLAPLIKSRKAAKTLSPQDYCLLHAADFIFRLENVIIPALNQGKIVLCDRYLFTSLSRGAARGLSPSWIRSWFEPIVQPDVVLYFSVSPETSLQRIRTTREPKYYEAGQDVTRIADPSESFKVFISRIIDQYERMAGEYDFLKVDAEQPPQAQHLYIRSRFQERYEEVRALHIKQPALQPFPQVRAS